MENLRNKCFFCSEPITGKKSLEHIIPDSLLGKLGIKEKKLTGNESVQYSRIKVPAHKSCNSEFGSRYETSVLALLEYPNQLYEDLIDEGVGIDLVYGPKTDKTSIITTWLLKVYYGLFYNDYLKTINPSWKQNCYDIINCENFRIVQKAYQYNHGYYLPSSLYIFRTENADFDLKTVLYPELILIKIKTLVFILVIGDGFLSKNYLVGEPLERLKEQLRTLEKADIRFPVHMLAFAEILALRKTIPKTPTFMHIDDQIINMSLSTYISNAGDFYKIDEELLYKYKKEILRQYNIQME